MTFFRGAVYNMGVKEGYPHMLVKANIPLLGRIYFPEGIYYENQ